MLDLSKIIEVFDHGLKWLKMSVTGEKKKKIQFLDEIVENTVLYENVNFWPIMSKLPILGQHCQKCRFWIKLLKSINF